MGAKSGSVTVGVYPMPESIQQMARAQRDYTRRLDANQNARLRRSNAAFHFQLPGQQAHLRVLYQQQQARAAAAHTTPTVPIDYAPLAWSLLFVIGFPALFITVIICRLTRQKPTSTPSTIPTHPGNLPYHGQLPYHAAASLLTPTEAHFYQTLRQAVGPMAVIQCKVRLADILVAPEHDFSAFRRVSQKHVDFILCERSTLRPLIAIELDDRSHDLADRKARDSFVDAAYASAHFPLIHVPVQPEYNSAEVLASLQRFLV